MNRIRPFLAKYGLTASLILVASLLYFANLNGWLMHDDEGTDFYEVWQLQEGQRPGVDFLAEQQPLYLLSGRFLLNHSQKSVIALRAFSVSQVLAAALFLAWVIKIIWGKEAALISFGVLLGSGMLYEQARLFRPDPMMLAWEMIGLTIALVAVEKKKKWLWALAGAGFGMAVLWKPFGVFPVVGLVIFFAIWLGKEKQQWRQIILSGLYFAIPFLLISGGVSAFFYNQLGFYYEEAFSYHLQANQGNGLVQQLLIVGGGYLLFLVSNAVFIFIFPLQFLNRKASQKQHLALTILNTQLFTPIIFLFITRPIHLRYFLFLLPTLAILLGYHSKIILQKLHDDLPQIRHRIPLFILFIVAASWFTSIPKISTLLLRQESDTLALATYVADHTLPTDVVVSDYAGINFFAKRPSIYEASIIAGAQINSGSITGNLLIRRMEETHAQIVLVHVAGGEPTPHQLVNLIDYTDFRSYLEEQFNQTVIFDRAGQQIEIFERK